MDSSSDSYGQITGTLSDTEPWTKKLNVVIKLTVYEGLGGPYPHHT